MTIAWQGGEPTLVGLDFFRRANSLARKHLRRRTTLEHTIQTNGTLLDEEWCEFLRADSFLVGLSMNGPQAMRDAYHVNKAGDPTFAQVFRAALLMQQRKVEFNILCTVHDAKVGHALEVYRFFRDEVGTRSFAIHSYRRASDQRNHRDRQCWLGRPRSRASALYAGWQRGTKRTVKPGAFLIGTFDE